MLSRTLKRAIQHKGKLVWSNKEDLEAWVWGPRVAVYQIGREFFVFRSGELDDAFDSLKPAVRRARVLARSSLSTKGRLANQALARGEDRAASLLDREAAREIERMRTRRDFASELRHLSIQALGRLLDQALRKGDEQKAALIEREIDRRTRGRTRRDRRRTIATFADRIKRPIYVDRPTRTGKRKPRKKRTR